MASSVVRAVDLSAWQGELAPAAIDGLKSDNVELVIIQAWGGGPAGLGPNPGFRVSADRCLAAGLAIAAYSWPPNYWLPALGIVAGRPINFLALDVEARAEVFHDQIKGVRAAGVRPNIYTSPSQWWEIMRNSSNFASEDFWLATYPNDGRPWPTSIDIIPWPLGRVIGWQWAGTTTLHDEQFDLNVFDRDYVFPPKEDKMEQADFDKIRDIVRAEGRAEAIYVKHPNHPSVYRLTEDQSLVGVVNPEVFGLQGDFSDVTVLPADSTVWNLEVTYPAGLPEELR